MREPDDSFRLDKSRLNERAKHLARPLSKVVTWGPLLKASRYLDAYFNFLMGRGCGTGWDLSEEVDAAVATLMTKQPTVFDIGANVGEWTRIFQQRVPGARVFLFEPAMGCHEYLTPLLGESVTLVPCAVGAEKGSAQLWSSAKTDGTASLHVHRETYFVGRDYRPSEVEVTTIDNFLDESSIVAVDFMKLDLEGHDFAALQGATQALADGKIRALSFEFGAGNINSRTYFHDFWDLLHPQGYRLSRIAPGGRLVPIRSYYEDLEYFRGVTNYVAVHDPVRGRARAVSQ